MWRVALCIFSCLAPCALILGIFPLLAETPEPPASSQRSALLIGINLYEPPGTHPHIPQGAKADGRFTGGQDFPNLKGPVNDVRSMRSLLTSAKFGFPDDPKRMHLLLDGEATRAGILYALNSDVAAAAPGSTVVVYFASHGSLRINDQGSGQLYVLNGVEHRLDGTIVPADAYLGAEDITSYELRSVFMTAARRGVHVTAIFDSCHSGGQARGAGLKLVKRSLAWDPRPILNQPAEKLPNGDLAPGPEDLKENPVLVFSASQKDQSSMEDDNGTPHGLFTTALIEALEALPAGARATDIFERVQVNLEIAGASNQQPALDTTPYRRRQPLFGGPVEIGPIRATVIPADDGTISLDIGTIADIGIGTEFRDISAGNGALLRVQSHIGIDRSSAIVVSPKGFSPKVGDILERTTVWIPAERPWLKFSAGPAGLTLEQIRSAASMVKAAGINLVEDPSSTPWTHILFWDGSSWVVQQHGLNGLMAEAEQAIAPTLKFGHTLSVDTLKKLPPNTVLWFDAPLASELAAMPQLYSDTTAAKLVTQRDQAQYVLVGNLAGEDVQYAWYSRGEFDADVQTPKGLGAGCSPTSAYPLRTEWISTTSPGPTDEGYPSLQKSAVNLAKLHAWLTMSGNSTDASAFEYSLGLQLDSTKEIMSSGAPTYNGQRYGLVLTAPTIPISTPSRWVYVLGIDCQGTGQILWPRSGPGGEFPTENGRLATIPLPGLSFRITPPYGTDTYILLTTSTALPEPAVLSFDGVVRGDTRGIVRETPLERLLRSASQGSRGNGVETPADWGIQIFQTHSHPVRSDRVDAATTKEQ